MSNTGLTHAVWRKSSRSDSNGGACVETARLDGGGMAVRDSKDQAGPVLLFSSDEWSAFIGGVQLGEFDL